MIIDGLIVFGAVALAFLGGYGVWLWLRRDDRRAGFTQPEHPGFGDIKRDLEIAHTKGGPPWGAAPEETSPAAPPPPPGAEQGTAAAAGGSPPPASPPPLPGHIAAHPERYAFEEWLRDDVAEADWAARALAETEALVKASYYKPLDGA